MANKKKKNLDLAACVLLMNWFQLFSSLFSSNELHLIHSTALHRGSAIVERNHSATSLYKKVYYKIFCTV